MKVGHLSGIVFKSFGEDKNGGDGGQKEAPR
jgi:hypothetical protein